MPKVSICSSLSEIDSAAWDRLVGEDQPFLEHGFLNLLETSGSVGEQAGWVPQHLLLYEDSELVAACPAYVKDNSRGEYIFDWSWADASMSNGIPYYPKLVIGVPFTPATGPRFLVHPDHCSKTLKPALRDALLSFCENNSIHGIHVLFCDEDEARRLKCKDFVHRVTHQYHWFNHGYENFDDFLAQFRSRPRKQVRKERRRVVEQGFQIQKKLGSETSEEDWALFYKFYCSTYARKWGSPYLTEAFFAGIPRSIGSRAVLITASDQNEVIAASLSFQKGQNLFGRYWGARRAYDCLHFELCYYQLIEHAISSGIQRVEAGAQGEHKVKRGFVPCAIHSLHHLQHPGIHEAVTDFTAREAHRTSEIVNLIAEHSPYRDDSLRRA